MVQWRAAVLQPGFTRLHVLDLLSGYLRADFRNRMD